MSIREMSNDELGKTVEAVASAEELFLDSEYGMEITRMHIGILREAARRLSELAGTEKPAKDMPAPDTLIHLSDGIYVVAAAYYLQGVNLQSVDVVNEIIKMNGLEKKVIDLSNINSGLADQLQHFIQTGNHSACRWHLQPHREIDDGWKMFCLGSEDDKIFLTYIRRPQSSARLAAYESAIQ